MDVQAHKRTLSIIHLVLAFLTIIFLLIGTMFIAAFSEFILEQIAREEGRETAAFVEVIFGAIRFFVWGIVLVIVAPSIIGGFAVLNGKSWGMVLLLISGCIALLNFPIGTAKGVYTIWVFVEDNKQLNVENKE